jgi:release factor glutamine methyltransferase
LAVQSDTAGLDAQVLLAHVLQKSRAWVLSHPDIILSHQQAKDFQKALERLKTGEPLPYVLGHQEFFGLEFKVTPATLIPRPETELLVEQAISWLKQHPHRRTAADIGTGSGCIAVALAVAIPDLRVFASDLSASAIAVARHNVQKHQVSKQVSLVQANLLPAQNRSLDLLCANLPYIPDQTLQGLQVYGKEPDLALAGGVDGLDVIRKLAFLAPHLLAPQGLLLFEIEASQRKAVLEMAERNFPGWSARVLPDLAGRDRLLMIEGAS